MLKQQVLDTLQDCENNYFVESQFKNILIGSIRGQFVSLLVIEGIAKPSKNEIKYQEKVFNSGGISLTIRTIDDLTEFKARGWYD